MTQGHSISLKSLGDSHKSAVLSTDGVSLYVRCEGTTSLQKASGFEK